MSTSPLCRWSEIAEARQFNEAAMFDQPLTVTKASHLHLRDLIAKIPPCFQRSGREPPVACAGQDAERLLPSQRLKPSPARSMTDQLLLTTAAPLDENF